MDDTDSGEVEKESSFSGTRARSFPLHPFRSTIFPPSPFRFSHIEYYSLTVQKKREGAATAAVW